MANERRRLVGRVVSDKMDKTVVVAIESPRRLTIVNRAAPRCGKNETPPANGAHA